MSSLLIASLLFVSASPPPPVTALAYRADGQQLAAGIRDTVLLIDPVNGEVTGELTGQTGRVTGLAYSSTGQLAVASGEPGQSGVVRLYPPGGSKPVADIPAHKDAIYAVAFAPDGKALATAGYDRLVKVWDVPPGTTPRLTLADHSDSVYALAYSPDGKLLASAAADRAVKVWDTATGKRLYTLSDPADWVYAVAWSPDGKSVAAGGVDKSIRIWEVTNKSGNLLRSAFAHDKAVTRLLYAPDGKTLYSVGEDQSLKAWKPDALTETVEFPNPPEMILAAALRADGKQLAVGRFDGVVHLIDPATGKMTHTPVPAKPKPPNVAKLTPNSGRRGTTVTVKVEGTHLEKTTARVTGATATVLRSQGLSVEITIPPDAPVGPNELRLTGPGGESKPVRFWIDRFPLETERGNTDASQTGMIVGLPVTIAGRLDRAGDADYYRFQAAAGQEIGVQLSTPPEASSFDPVLTLTDESGQVVAEGPAGRLGYVCPTAGIYSVGVRDEEYRGGNPMTYRLHIGPIPIVTGVFPLGVQRGVETSVRVVGVNLGKSDGLIVPVKPPPGATIGTKIPVPMERSGGDPVGPATVVVGEFPATNVLDGSATLESIPGTADGELSRPGESHGVWFRATKKQRLIIETHADRLESPVDTSVEILDAKGNPVPKAVLRCLAKTTTNLRDRSSSDPGIRIEAWNEFAMADYVYADGELMRIDELPRGPDDDCRFVAVEGRRVGFLGTTPKYHAYGTGMYKVAVHAPGTKFPPNGMPVFTLYERNDDGGPGYGRDSRVVFDPPADGTYQVRVSDATGAGGPDYGYRLTVRPARPDFTIRLTPNNPSVPKGGTAALTVTATRMDGFDGPIAVQFEGLKTPFHSPATTIDEGRTTTSIALCANGGSAGPSEPLRLTGRAWIDGEEVVREAKGSAPKTIENTDGLITSTAVQELSLRPGTETRLTVRVQRNGFNGRIPLDVRGLPYGVRVMNVGLNGILVLPGQTEREVFIFAEPWVEPSERPFIVVARKEGGGEFAAPPVTLTIPR